MGSLARTLLLGASLACALGGCSKRPAEATLTSASASVPKEAAPPGTLAAARQSFVTKVRDTQPRGEPAPKPPSGVLDFVRYPSPIGALSAYVSPAPGDGTKRPAMIWLPG